MALSAVLQIAAVLLPPLQELLGTQTLSPAVLAACALAATIPGTALRVTAWVLRPERTGSATVPTDRHSA